MSGRRDTPNRRSCPVSNCGCVYHAEDGSLCDYAQNLLAEVDRCRFTLTNAMGAQCETHGRVCPRANANLRSRT